MDFIFTLKKTLTLLALVDPFLAVPIFMSAIANLDLQARRRFCRQLAFAVGGALLVGGLFGLHFLSFMGVSLAAMQVGGGAIVFVVALAMVLAKEEEIKHTQADTARASESPSIVPLGIPLLVGPAAMSYVMATSNIAHAGDVLQVVAPPLLVAIATWLCFIVASQGKNMLSASALSVIEKVSGFLLSAIAIEMMATGMKILFPGLRGVTG